MHGDDPINAAITKHWGEIATLSPAQAQAEIARLNTVLSAGSGNPRTGKQLFMQNCGRCHLLFDEGGRIGPDLTPFARTNLERMLISVVNPSLEIREGFENYVVVTVDGRVLNGFLADKDSQIVILRSFIAAGELLTASFKPPFCLARASPVPEKSKQISPKAAVPTSAKSAYIVSTAK